MIIEYYRCKDNAETPVRSNPSDAGLDVFALQKMCSCPRSSTLIPLGLKFGVPHGFMLQVMNRSSIASKRSLIVGAHIIDSGYNGEVFINLHNVGGSVQTIKHGQKIAQLDMIPVVPFRPTEIVEDTLYEDGITISNRGDGALGALVDKDTTKLM